MLPYTNRARGQDAKDNPELARTCTYDLFSVIVHVGEIDTGHYVAYCRVGDQVSHYFSSPELFLFSYEGVLLILNTQWFAFNDHRVELATKSDVLSARAYLLFYIVRYLS